MKHRGLCRRSLFNCCVALSLCTLALILLSRLPSTPKGLPRHLPSMLVMGPSAHTPTVAVVGSGLAGLVAALEASRAAGSHGVRVVVFEKNSNVGGNSAKASSGINAVNSEVGDTQELYSNDTLKSGGGLSDEQLVQQLVVNSKDAVSFLEACGVQLSNVVRLGGHSMPRTRSNPTGPNVGFALIQAVASQLRQDSNVQIISGAKVTYLDRDAQGKLRLSYTQAAGTNAAGSAATTTAAAATGVGPRADAASSTLLEQVLLADAVILATGGFAASKELLQKYAPEAAALPTTNGAWATGEGLLLGTGLGAALVQMEQVQVHPTGFVDPSDPNATTKWLAPEKLRGCGALLLAPDGKRFVDELTTRDKVSAALLGLPGKRCWLLLGREEAAQFGEGTLGFYASKKLVTKVGSLQAAAEHMGVLSATLEHELSSYSAASEGRAADTWGKKYFPNKVSPAGPFWIAQVTPVVHYCMGGLKIDTEARVLTAAGKPIPGLFAAGEVSGGLHGKNRLGGNSLAECAVFGRVAAQGAMSHVRQSTSEVAKRLGAATAEEGMLDAATANVMVAAVWMVNAR